MVTFCFVYDGEPLFFKLVKLYDIDDKVNQQLAEIRKVSRHVANICERADQVYPASHRIG
jgi:hypothetical protein